MGLPDCHADGATQLTVWLDTGKPIAYPGNAHMAALPEMIITHNDIEAEQSAEETKDTQMFAL